MLLILFLLLLWYILHYAAQDHTKLFSTVAIKGQNLEPWTYEHTEYIATEQ